MAKKMSELHKRRMAVEKFVLPHHHGQEKHIEKLREALLKAEQFGMAAEIFKQLGDPTRVRIFWLLSHQESCVVNISALMNMSSPAVFHHLKSLHSCGLIVSRREGKEVHYRAADTEACKLLHEMVEQVMEIACPEKTVDYRTSPQETVRCVHEYMVEHLAERITIEELSRKFLMNPTTLKQVFKKTYGNSIAAHMKEHRLERAAQLLASTGESIADISKEVGYESHSRFSTAFKEAYGMLPMEYRKHCRA